MDSKISNQIREDKQTSIFRTSLGVKQGGPLSPRLFALYMEELIDKLDANAAGIEIEKIKINNIFYAYEILLVSKTPEELNDLLKITEEYGKRYEIKFNSEKTNFMILCNSRISKIFNEPVYLLCTHLKLL